VVQSYPVKIDPYSCAERGRRWEGELPVERFPRLRRLVLNPKAPVRFQLRFGREDHRCVARGSVETVLRLVCQRCLEPVEVAIEQPIAVGIVTTLEEGERLPEPLEPFVVKEGEEIPLTEILEEEILLALPPFPRHEGCRPPGEQEGFPPASRRQHPFATLRQLKER